MRIANQQQLTSYGRLNGSTQFAQVANFSDVLGNTSKFSCGCWVKFGRVHPAAERTVFRFIFPVGSGIYFNRTNSQIFRFYTYDSVGNNVVVSNIPTLPETWNHIVYTGNMLTKVFNCYLNGVLVGTVGAQTLVDTIWAAGGQQTSYFGSDVAGSSALDCNLHDIFAAPSTEMDAFAVWNLFSAGHLPPNSFHWPCDDVGNLITCYKDNARYPLYDAVLQGGDNLFTRNTPTQVRTVDTKNNGYVNLDGIADYINISDALINPSILGSKVLVGSIWYNTRTFPASAAGMLYYPDGSGITGFAIRMNSTGLIDAAARSRTAGTSGVTVTSANNWGSKINRNEWHHAIAQADYVNKTLTLWMDGMPVTILTAIAWEDLAFTCGIDGTTDFHMGNVGTFFPGKFGTSFLGRREIPITDKEAFDWYANAAIPNKTTTILSVEFPNTVAPIDTGPNAFPVTQVSMPSGAFGLQSNLFGGPGR